jgi:hypothetical protein
MTASITDAQIEAQIAQHDDPEHPDAATVAEVRDVLQTVHEQLLGSWADVEDILDESDATIVHEDASAVVIADPTGHLLGDELDMAGVNDAPMHAIVRGAYHEAAKAVCDYDWSVASPIVLEMPPEWHAAREHALRSVARRARSLEDGRLAAAVDQVVVDEWEHYSPSVWARLTARAASSLTRSRNRL